MTLKYFVEPLVIHGVLQIICGVAIFLMDVIGTAAYQFSCPEYFLGIILGIFCIVTGSLTTATGSASRKGASNGRSLAVGSLVMSILCSLSSFALMILTILILATSSVLTIATCRNEAPQENCFDLIHSGPTMLRADIVFLLAMFITSIVACVFSCRAMSAMRKTTAITHVTYVVQPGAVYTVQLHSGGYPQPPTFHPAGHPPPYSKQTHYMSETVHHQHFGRNTPV